MTVTIREVLKEFLDAAQSWHTMHDPDGAVQCDSICELIPRARAALRPVNHYGSVGQGVAYKGAFIARAVSKTMAKRIANALNNHKPNREGV